MVDASGQSLAYFYARENDNDAGTAGVLTMDEARRLASNFAPGCRFPTRDMIGCSWNAIPQRHVDPQGLVQSKGETP